MHRRQGIEVEAGQTHQPGNVRRRRRETHEPRREEAGVRQVEGVSTGSGRRDEVVHRHADQIGDRPRRGDEGGRSARVVRVGEHGVHAGTAGIVGSGGQRARQRVPVGAVAAHFHRGRLGERRQRRQARRQEGVLEHEQVGTRLVHDHVVVERERDRPGETQRHGVGPALERTAAAGRPEHDRGKLALAGAATGADDVRHDAIGERLGAGRARRHHDGGGTRDETSHLPSTAGPERAPVARAPGREATYT
jgi:hypothetical protein